MLMTLLSSASGNAGSESIATLARTNRTLRGLRASSADFTVAQRLKKHAALYRAHRHVIPAVDPPVDMYLQGFARHPGLVKPHWYIG